jgi:NAD+ synthase
LGRENVLAVMMPYRTSSPESEAHARQVIGRLQLLWEKIEITGMVDALTSRFPDMSAGRKGNLMARCRMTVLYDQSAAFGALVAGTSNRTETLLGYFTIHGDGAAGLKPIAHLYKCQVRALARRMGVPSPIVAKAPSADLWAGQTDEGELGFSYDDADRVLFLASEAGLSQDEIIAQGIKAGAVRAILRRVSATAFKRRDPASLTPDGAGASVRHLEQHNLE